MPEQLEDRKKFLRIYELVYEKMHLVLNWQFKKYFLAVANIIPGTMMIIQKYACLLCSSLKNLFVQREENHPPVLTFFQILPIGEGGKSPSRVDFFPNSANFKNQLSDITHLFSVVGPVGRASACRSVGRGFEALFCNTSVVENLPVLSGRLVIFSVISRNS